MTAKVNSIHRKKNPANPHRAPKMRHHKISGRAYAVLNGKAIYFGKYGALD
jgi:hypothetical protein